MDEYEYIGDVWVDGGTMVLADPFDDYYNSETLVEDIIRVGNGGEIKNGVVVVRTGLGDGVYPVEVRYTEVPGWGRRVAEVKVVFIPEDK